ncbi:MAG TPA: hypothetical protein O0X38_06230 [Methanocorpusculum sp.]|nr:hypothetical protein [Methanocorpusculum sp.]
MLWIVASFFIYMFYFFLMMIPSLGSGTSTHITDAATHIQIREFLRLANLLKTFRKNKVTFIEIFWNAFLINAKPLAKRDLRSSIASMSSVPSSSTQRK